MAKLGYGIGNNMAVRAAQKASNKLSLKIHREMLMMKKAIVSLERRIIADVAKLQQSPDGLLMGPRVNLKQAQKLHTAMSYQFEEIYGKAITKHVKGYGEVGDWVLENFNDLDFAADWTDIDLTMIQQLQKQSALGFAQLGNAAKTSVQQALYNNIAAQAPFEELVGSISGALTGKYSKAGKPLSQYAELYANDGIMNFYNSVHLQKGDDLGIEYYMYSGTIMANTRDFCRRRAQRVFSIEEINSWTHKWTGKSGPALTHRGGWNCRHHWQAVRSEWIPEIEDDVPQTGKKKKADENPMTSIGNLSDCCI